MPKTTRTASLLNPVARQTGTATFARVAAHGGKLISNSLRANAAGAAVTFGIEQAGQTVLLATGTITPGEYGRRTARNAAGTTGALAGTAAGAAIGTLLCPGAGTAIGGAVGGILGAFGLAHGVEKLLG